jgi:hypothetical protein
MELATNVHFVEILGCFLNVTTASCFFNLGRAGWTNPSQVTRTRLFKFLLDGAGLQDGNKNSFLQNARHKKAGPESPSDRLAQKAVGIEVGSSTYLRALMVPLRITNDPTI